MEDERGSTPRGASARGRAGEPAAGPTRATGRPPAAIFMEPAIPAPREAEPEPIRHAGPVAGRGADGEPPPVRSQAAASAPAKPAVAPVQPPNPAPPTKAAPPAKAAPRAETTPPNAAPVKTTPPNAAPPAKATPVKAAPPVKATPANAAPPAKATPARTEPVKAAGRTTAAPPAEAAAVEAAPAVKAAPAAVEAASPAKATKATKAAAPAKTAAAAKATKTTAPAKAAPAKATPTKATPVKGAATKAAPAKTTASKATKAAPAKAAPKAAKAAEPPVDSPDVVTPRSAEPPAHEPPARAPGSDLGPVPSLWDLVRAEPRQAPELLTRAAVERYGPEADRYTRWIRATYPTASDDRVAQAAARRFTAQARRAALAAVVGHGAGETAALGWVQARMVLHIAAAYRLDPAAPERAAELLTLMRPARVPVGAGVRAAGRGLATRLVPGAGLLLGALVNDAETGSLARRAISLYRPVPRLP